MFGKTGFPGRTPQTERRCPYGNAVLSRYGLYARDPRKWPRPNSHESTIPGIIGATARVTFDRSNQTRPLRLFSTHIGPIEVPKVLAASDTRHTRRILTGDFNIWPGRPPVGCQSCNIRPFYDRYNEAWGPREPTGRRGWGRPGTLTFSSHNLHKKLDYIFLTRNIPISSPRVLTPTTYENNTRVHLSDHALTSVEFVVPR